MRMVAKMIPVCSACLVHCVFWLAYMHLNLPIIFLIVLNDETRHQHESLIQI
jgi:hypothetical protein